MATLKYSRQRESIKAFLASRTDHPTAEVIYKNLRQTDPHISLGTVYRNLNLLEQLGEIMRVSAGDGTERFDFTTAVHHHFLCDHCHSVYDLKMENIDFIMTLAQKEFRGKIDRYQTIFHGTCESCMAKEKASDS